MGLAPVLGLSSAAVGLTEQQRGTLYQEVFTHGLTNTHHVRYSMPQRAPAGASNIKFLKETQQNERHQEGLATAPMPPFNFHVVANASFLLVDKMFSTAREIWRSFPWMTRVTPNSEDVQMKWRRGGVAAGFSHRLTLTTLGRQRMNQVLSLEIQSGQLIPSSHLITVVREPPRPEVTALLRG